MPCKVWFAQSTRMTNPMPKTSLRRSSSLILRSKRVSSEGDKKTPDRKLENAEGKNITYSQFYVLHPKPRPLTSTEGTPSDQSSPTPGQNVSCSVANGQTYCGTAIDNNGQLSPKSILKKFTAASYRNPVLVTDVENERSVKWTSCLRSRDAQGKQASNNFRYRLTFNVQPSVNEKRVTFDEEVSYVHNRERSDRRRSTSSLGLPLL